MATSMSPRNRFLLGAALIAVITIAVYAPSLRGDFLLDDNNLITNNQLVRAPGGWYQFWCTTNAADYWPLTNSSFWLEWRLWGPHPAGYRLTNLLLHLVSAVLLWAILRKLAIPGAFLAALLFAVHPVNVESVAWISQRKNTLAILFFLLSILCYLPIVKQRTTDNEPRTSAWYWLSLLAFVLAMLSKGSVVILPVLLLLLAWWQRRRIAAADLARTAPFFLVATLLGAVNVWFQTHSFADAIRTATFSQRLAGAGAITWFYLAKAFLPIDLLFVYRQWNVQAGHALWWLPIPALVIATAVLWRHRHARWARPLLFAWAFFCVALVPVLGFTDVGFMQFSLVADHYQQIALIAVVAIMAAALAQWHKTALGAARLAAAIAPAAIAICFAALTWQRSTLFESAANLYATTLQSNPDCWQLHNSLAVVLNRAGKFQAAGEQCLQALRLHPNSADAHFNLAVALGRTNRIAESVEEFQRTSDLRPERAAEIQCAIANMLIAAGRFDEAIQHCQKSLELNPDEADAFRSLGIAQLSKGRPSLAIEQFREASRREPDNAEILEDLAEASIAAGQPQQAIVYYQQALQLNSGAPEIHHNLGNLLVSAGRLEEALAQFQQALALQPEDGAAEGNLGSALLQLRRPSEAIEHLEHAARLQPGSSDARSNLGIALSALGRTQESIAQFQESLKLNPENVAAHFNYGVALNKAGQQQEAIGQLEESLQLAPTNAGIYAELITAYVRLNQPEKAIAVVERGLEIARTNRRPGLVRQLEDWLANLRAQQADSQEAARIGGASPDP